MLSLLGVLRDRLFWIPPFFGIPKDPYSCYLPFVESLGIPVFPIIPLCPILGSLRPLNNQVLGVLRSSWQVIYMLFGREQKRGGGSGVLWLLAGPSVELVAIASVMFL